MSVGTTLKKAKPSVVSLRAHPTLDPTLDTGVLTCEVDWTYLSSPLEEMLRSNGLARHAALLAKNGVNSATLPRLEEEKARRIPGLTRAGVRRLMDVRTAFMQHKARRASSRDGAHSVAWQRESDSVTVAAVWEASVDLGVRMSAAQAGVGARGRLLSAWSDGTNQISSPELNIAA